MFAPLPIPRLYPITDTRLSGLSHTEQVERLAAAGATFIQLREKHASPRDFYTDALCAIRAARRLGVRVIINDRVDIAIAVNADGVHVGQDDLPVSKARLMLGESAIIGYSTHSLKQAVEASFEPIDYIAIGPVFHTDTKENPDPVVGLEGIAEVRKGISKPLVAVGGITLDRARSVIEAGADSLAVISDLYRAGEIENRVKAYLRALG